MYFALNEHLGKLGSAVLLSQHIAHATIKNGNHFYKRKMISIKMATDLRDPFQCRNIDSVHDLILSAH